MRSVSPGRRHSWEPAAKRAVVESKRRSASVDELDSHSEGDEVEEEAAQISTSLAEERGEEEEEEAEDEEEAAAAERKQRLEKADGAVAERPRTLEGTSPPFGTLYELHDLSPDAEDAGALAPGSPPHRKSAIPPQRADHDRFANKSRSRSVSLAPSPDRRTQSATLPPNMSLSSLAMTQAEEPGVVSPIKPDGEKAGTRVARTFSFLKNRMTSTKNRNKCKNKENKEKPLPGGGHQFASATFSSPTSCAHCGKALGARDALQCLSCNVCVHRNCAEYLSPCPKHSSKTKLSGGDVHLFSYAGHTHPPHRALSVSLSSDGRSPHGAALSPTFHSRSFSVATSPGATMAGPATLPKSGSSGNLQSSVLDEMDSETEHGYGQSGDPLPHAGDGYIKPSDSPPNEAAAASLEGDVVDAAGPMRSLDVIDPEGFDVESWSRAVTPAFLKQLEPSAVKRQDVIYELMLTEIHHVRTLHIMSDVFARGMREEAALDDATVDRVFPRLAELRELHEGFLAALCERRRRAVEDTGGGGGGGGSGGAQTNGSIAGAGDGRNFVIARIGDLLVQQFSDASAERLVNVYGEFCGRQKEAVSLYKEQLNRKAFHSFVMKQSLNPNTRRLGVPECILLVTQRITKYPVLITEILKHTKDDPEEHAELTRALALVKEAVSGVDARVRERERQCEVAARVDSRSQGRTIGGRPFLRRDLASPARRLLHEGAVHWKTAAGRNKEVWVLLMTDVLIFLQEKDQKYVFASLDQKAAVLALHKLIVREVALEESEMFLISASNPEMYKLNLGSRESRDVWIQRIRSAVECCTEDTVCASAELEETIRLKNFCERLIELDQRMSSSVEDKLRIYSEMSGGEVAFSMRSLLRADATEPPRAEPIVAQISHEVRALEELVRAPLWVPARHGSVVSCPTTSPTGSPPPLPRRSGTFSAFDCHDQVPELASAHRLSLTETQIYDPPPEFKDSARPGGRRNGTDAGSSVETDAVHSAGTAADPEPCSSLDQQALLNHITKLKGLVDILKVAVSRQDSALELQRFFEREGSRAPRPGSLFLEHEKQRNMEKQREELASVHRRKAELQREQKQWEHKQEQQRRELEERQRWLRDQEEESRRARDEADRLRHELQRHREDYQRDLEHLRDSQRSVERERLRLEGVQQRLQQRKQGAGDAHEGVKTGHSSRSNSFLGEPTSEVGGTGGGGAANHPHHQHSASFSAGDGGDAGALQPEPHLAPPPYPGSVRAGVGVGGGGGGVGGSPGPGSSLHREDSNASMFGRNPAYGSYRVPQHLLSATNESLKPTEVLQQIPKKLLAETGGKVKDKDRDKEKEKFGKSKHHSLREPHSSNCAQDMLIHGTMPRQTRPPNLMGTMTPAAPTKRPLMPPGLKMPVGAGTLGGTAPSHPGTTTTTTTGGTGPPVNPDGPEAGGSEQVFFC